MPEVGRWRVAVLVPALLALVATGCSGDDDPDGDDGPATPAASSSQADGGTDGETSAAPVTGDDEPGGLVLPDSLSVSLDGSEVLADCWEGVCRWETTTGSLAEVSPGSHVAMSPDWSLRAGVLQDGTVVLADPGSGDTVRELPDLAGPESDGESVTAVVFSRDGSRLAAADLTGRVVVWSVEDGSPVARLSVGTEVHALAFDPEGRRLAVVDERSVSLHPLGSGRDAVRLPGSSGDADEVAWSPDGRFVAGPGADGVPTLWAVRGSRRVAELTGVELERLAFSPDSTSLAVTADDEVDVRLWTPRRDDVRELAGHLESPEAVAFGPDGTRLYSVSGSDGVLAWDTDSGEVAVELELPRR